MSTSRNLPQHSNPNPLNQHGNPEYVPLPGNMFGAQEPMSASPNVSQDTNNKPIGSPQPSGQGSEAGSGTEYSPESKPVKSETNGGGAGSSSELTMNNEYSRTSSPSFIGVSTAATSFGSTMSHHATAHPLPTYPYMGNEYGGAALFHPASMFKAATLARVTKKRSSTGE